MVPASRRPHRRSRGRGSRAYDDVQSMARVRVDRARLRDGVRDSEVGREQPRRRRPSARAVARGRCNAGRGDSRHPGRLGGPAVHAWRRRGVAGLQDAGDLRRVERRRRRHDGPRDRWPREVRRGAAGPRRRRDDHRVDRLRRSRDTLGDSPRTPGHPGRRRRTRAWPRAGSWPRACRSDAGSPRSRGTRRAQTRRFTLQCCRGPSGAGPGAVCYRA